MRSRAVLSGMVVAAWLAAAGAADGATFVDQQFEPDLTSGNDASQAFGQGNDVGQTFTVGRTGTLRTVSVLLSLGGGVTDPLTLDIRTTDVNGAPAEANTTPPALASVTLAAAAIPGTAQWVSFDLSAADLAVTAGDVLAIVLRSGSGGLGVIGYSRYGETLDPYPAGAAFFRDSTHTTAWLEMTGFDFGFATFVEPELCFGSAATIAGAGKIVGTPGEDVIVGSVGDDKIDGGGGPDAICGLEGNDDISDGGNTAADGGPGDDRIKLGGTGGTLVSGGDGNDQISVKQVSGSNSVSGGAGSDRIKVSTKLGSTSATAVDGGDGDDTIQVSNKGGGGIVVDGGPGTDRCKVKGAVPSCELTH